MRRPTSENSEELTVNDFAPLTFKLRAVLSKREFFFKHSHLYMKLVSDREVRASIYCHFKRDFHLLPKSDQKNNILEVGLRNFKFHQGSLKQKTAQIKEVVSNLVDNREGRAVVKQGVKEIREEREAKRSLQ